MAKCKYFKREVPKVCIGDLNKRVIVKTAAIAAATNVSYGRDFDNHSTPWAMIKTLNGIIVFDSTNQERTASHQIIIRYDANITAEYWVEYNSNNLDILTTENINEESQFLKLICGERGVKTLGVNLV
jgi:SPP1 family predicted phage head-tail adaptor